MNLILGLFSWIDFFIHTGVAEVFKLIFRIAEVDIFTEEAIATFANRIYGILGVLILFKIVISCIQYLVSPDKMADKDKGMGALITRTIISFVLLALVPTIFSFAKKVETNIAGVIPTIILGQNVDYRTQDGQTAVEKVGSWMSFVTLKTFVTEKEDKKTEIANKNLKMENFDDFKKNIMVGCGVFSLDGCVYDYNVVFSLLVGVFMLYILLSMGVDIAIRTIKLGILQILAPIPIASYINGQENFKTWYQTALKVYADLFIRLIVIYFIVYIMATIGSGGMSIGFLTDPFVVIYIIVGLLMFAKQAPKFICDILGIKSDGFGDIGNMFKRGAGLAATTLAGIKTARSNYTTQKERNLGKGLELAESRTKALKSAAAGMLSATGRGLLMTGQGKGFNDVRKNAFDKAIAARNARNDRVDNLYNTDVDRYNPDGSKNNDYYGYWEYRKDKHRSALGIPSTPGFTKAKYDVVDQLAQSTNAEKSFGATKMNETPNDIKIDVDGRNYTIATARTFADIQVGTENVTKPDGTIGTWTVDDRAKAMQVKEIVEKKTSYIKTAELLANGDATARLNNEKTILNIKNNKTSIDGGTLSAIYAQLSTFMSSSELGPQSDFDVDRMIGIFEALPQKGDQNSINNYAKVLTAFKTGFENDRTNKYAAAQAAEARAKKTQEAINNDKKS